MEALLQDRAAAKALTKPAMHFSIGTRIIQRLKSVAMLWLLLLTVPVSLALVAICLAWEWAALVGAGQGAEVMRRLRVAVCGRQQPVLGTALVSGGLTITVPSHHSLTRPPAALQLLHMQKIMHCSCLLSSAGNTSCIALEERAWHEERRYIKIDAAVCCRCQEHQGAACVQTIASRWLEGCPGGC